jgi:hypothetical protein
MVLQKLYSNVLLSVLHRLYQIKNKYNRVTEPVMADMCIIYLGKMLKIFTI